MPTERRLNTFEDVDLPLADGPGPSERYLDLHRYWSVAPLLLVWHTLPAGKSSTIGFLQHAGDHFYVPNPQPSSWADGTHVLVGKDHIDFDLNLQSIDPVKQTAVVVVHHVPPSHPNLEFPAAWMQSPVADTANNWVEVTKTKEGKYEAGVGKETFDVKIIVSTVDGKILSASMENPVVTISRECNDAALAECGAAQKHTIHRHVEIVLGH
jgi:hypothetical protein